MWQLFKGNRLGLFDAIRRHLRGGSEKNLKKNLRHDSRLRVDA
jgi:hypothetical protein